MNVLAGACLVLHAVAGATIAAKLVEVLAVDNRCLILHWQDGAVEYLWDDLTSGSQNGWDYYHTEDWHLCKDKDRYIPYGAPLDTGRATRPDSFHLVCSDDPNYGQRGKSPLKVHRKSKVWEACHDERKAAMHHWIYLELPEALKRGGTYNLEIGADTNSDPTSVTFTFDEFALESPSIKASNLGYEADAPCKQADVYLWMGDGGGRDFSRLQGTPWHLYDVEAKQPAYSGTLKRRAGKAAEPTGKDLTGADVWECDFSSFCKPGRYRLVVEGIGCSPTFTIGENLFEEALRVAMQGMFYQRMGCDRKPAGGFPYARRPLYKQSVEPEDFVLRISNRNMVTGKNPDDMNWYAADATDRVVKESWGGWCDAYDNDQRPVNYICVFDVLLTYYLSPTSFRDNQLHVPEVGNHIPDIIDEALWEIDWWLRMRDPEDGGYLTGLCNIKPPKTVNYAGAACAWQGWCVAAGCAMVADCFRLAGLPELQQKYIDAALEAYAWASRQTDLMLDVGVSGLRGRDLKMTAAAFLYNLTGERRYEDVVKAESTATSAASKVAMFGKWIQHYGAIAYIMTPRKVNYPELRANMIASIIGQAKVDHVDHMAKSPTRAARWPVGWEGMCQTSNEMSPVAIAHRLTEDPAEKEYFERGLYSEAEWTLGRNPLGLVQMTGLTDRCVTQTFAPGRRDGAPGLTPGWTPYMCRDGWQNSDDIHRCAWYTNRNYPSDKEVWPWGEHFWNSRYCVPNSESTPQQNFRQKIVLYGYLCALSNKSRTATGVTSGG